MKRILKAQMIVCFFLLIGGKTVVGQAFLETKVLNCKEWAMCQTLGFLKVLAALTSTKTWQVQVKITLGYGILKHGMALDKP
jgi:hypothetical protein